MFHSIILVRISFHFISDVYSLLSMRHRGEFDFIVNSNVNIINCLRSVNNDTLLMYTAFYTEEEVFDHLINIPQDFAIVNNYKSNIIHQIAWSSKESMLIKILKKTNVENLINKKDRNGNTPLHYAAFQNKHEMIRQLLLLGSDVNARNEKNELPDEQSECDEVTKRLIQSRRW